MPTNIWRILGTILLGFLIADIVHAQKPPANNEWTIISTDDLDQWSDPGRWWKSENQVLVAESRGGENFPKEHCLVWNEAIKGDVELSLEYRVQASAPQDAGFYFRAERSVQKNGIPVGYQAELDTANQHGNDRFTRRGKLFGNIHDGKRKRMFRRNSKVIITLDGKENAGSLANKFVPARVYRKSPEWNHCRVVLVGHEIQLFLNGVLANHVIDEQTNRSNDDAIALQFRPSQPYRFEVRDLKYRTANRSTLDLVETGSTNTASKMPISKLLPANDLSGFRVFTRAQGMGKDPNRVFSLQEGELAVSGTEHGLLITKGTFSNYRLVMEYRWDTDAPKRDSGVFVNTIEKNGKFTSLECNLLGPEKGLSGQVFLLGPGRKQLQVNDELIKKGPIEPRQKRDLENPVGQWNTMDVICDNGRFKVRVNGQETVGGFFPKPRSGSIMWQSNSGAIRFRNVNVIDYDASTAEAIKSARAGDFDKSARLFEKFLTSEPDANESGRGLWLATLYAAAGDRKAHEKHSREFFNRLANRQLPSDASRPAKAYVILPGANDPELLEKALECSQYSTDKNPNSIWYLLTRAMVQYRRGHDADVLRWLEKPIRSKNNLQLAPALAFAAMAEHRLGNTKKARKLLRRAEASNKKVNRSSAQWNDVIGAQLAIDEAKATIK